MRAAPDTGHPPPTPSASSTPGATPALAETLPELMRLRVALTPGREAYRQFDVARGTWISYSWQEIGAQIERWRRALLAENLPPAARIGLLVPNSVEHVCLDQAALSLGLVPVPMHVVDNPESLTYVLADSDAALLCVESYERWAALAAHQDRMPSLRRVVYLSGSQGAAQPGIALSATEWLRGALTSDYEMPRPSPDALAAIVYTSGTTGRPKGVMLSHRNITSNVRAILSVLPVFENDVFLSFLPLSHTLERTAGYYLPIAAGAAVVYARSVSLLMSDLREIRPTVLISVPRIYERAYVSLRETVERSAVRRAIFALTVRLGWQRFQHRQGVSPRPSRIAHWLWQLLDRSVAAQVRERFGGRVRAAVTGGAPLSTRVAQPFLALGVPLLQGYGMTESAPVVACNTPEDNDPESVGRALPGVEVELGERDELLVRGPNVMIGYWKRPEDTGRALDGKRWLHTGDQARLRNGRIYVTGRIKDILVTSTGEKIAPVDLETAILLDPIFEQVMVLGEGRPYVAALAVLSPRSWEARARELHLAVDDANALRSPAIVDWALEHIRSTVSGFPSYARPRAVALLRDPWTVAEGLLTPTLKPKRAAIEAQFAEEIAQLYRGHA